ncbi:hypothetical protein YA0783_24980 [Pseudomonas corrugata]|uniref:hypothetical protein n=1 Tax=Pseudomonas corrugata TaxID=47879 RepID=UPI0018E630CB|nr:hypothetical protein [Pseudomonas corrugata]MBI6621546.1 hypothetical protein [Pseudomonas corrugata]MBI6694219.1 hypothetical protein [Pseudomonas corrugata]
MEFLIGYLFGSAVRHKNPLQLVLGFMGASLLLWLLAVAIAALCAAAPHAAALIEAVGLNKVLPFLDSSISDVQADVSVLDVFSVQFLTSSILLCAVVLFALNLCLIALNHLVRLVVIGTVALFKKLS